ncbi:L-dopachrome tautomerase yellow-f2-like isoform X1 [Rhynchophorus ferrugineus]|uniref:L-dopachrome tautomerase yellow-f2-like isoform X1 n=2 Tax=Rhynchophorus ferrugineus TaxID=354439 RepID=UPI003FCE350D
MKVRIFLYLVYSYITTVARSIGLKDEFTWSRINYDWTQDSSLIARFSGMKVVEESGFFFNGLINVDSYTPTEGTKISPSKILETTSVDYQYANNIPMGANVWKNKLFITVPRRRLGVPSTLNYIPLDSPVKHNVPLIPYPSWSLNLFPDTSGKGDNLVSIYRVEIDTCDRMWFVDTGVIEIPGNATRVKEPQLILINLQTDEIIHRVTVSENVLRPNTLLASVTVDLPKQFCSKAFAYLPDLGGFGLIVYSLEEDRFWRVNHNYFYLEPAAGEFLVGGYNFQWNDGVFSVELSQEKPDGFRDMYFHSMAGTHIYKVSTKVLRNETLSTRSYHANDFTNIGDRGPKSQTSMADIHKASGIMFLGLVNKNAVACWNTQKGLKTISIVHKDDSKMVYPSDVKVSGDQVFVLTNRMPVFLYGKLNYDDVNFRIWFNTVEDAVKYTNCAA